MNELPEDIYVERIESGDSPQNSINLTMAVLCFVGIGIFFYLVDDKLTFDPSHPDFNPLVLIPLMLLLYGLFSLCSACIGYGRARKFGRVFFDMEDDSYIGGSLKGKIVTQSMIVPTADWDIRLQLLETVTYKFSNESRTEDKVRWESVQKIRNNEFSSRDGIPVDIKIPENSRKIMDKLKGPARWVLGIEAPLEGIDFKCSFGIRVHSFKPKYDD